MVKFTKLQGGMKDKVKERIKNFFDSNSQDVLVIFVIVLVATASFGLGRMSATGEGRGKVKLIEAKALEANSKITETERPILQKGGQVVASKLGSKYYLPFCKSAQRIKEENKIYFDSQKAAIAAGYTAALNCPGLK